MWIGQAGRKIRIMIRAFKRLIMAAAIMAAASAPVFGTLTAAVTPTVATTNSIWNIAVTWTYEQSAPDPIKISITGLGAGTLVIYDEAGANPSQYVAESTATSVTYRVAVSCGLNMYRMQQRPKAQRTELGEVYGTDPEDADNPLLLLDPRGNGMWYAPALVSAARTFTVTAEFAPAEEGADPPDPVSVDLTVTVHGSSWGRTDYDGNEDTVETVVYGGAANRDKLINYPGGAYPSIFYGPDPLTILTPSSVVQPNITPDDGSSSSLYEFRVHYENESGLPPKPWMPSWMDTFGATNETGVVLYLGLMNPLDPSGGYWYEPHFMRPENPADTDYTTGVDYIYRLMPGHTRQINLGATANDIPAPRYSNDYMALLTGTYHYFFACSDDSLTFENGEYLLSDSVQDNSPDWGSGEDAVDMGPPTGFHEVSGTGLDPYFARNLMDENGNPYMPRPEGRRYSAFGDELFEPKDTQIYVDRVSRVPGVFESYYFFQYPDPATEHPQVTLQLSAYNDRQIDGFGRFFGTIEPYYRSINPTTVTPWGRDGFGDWGLRMESSGATTSTEITFKVKYYQTGNKPPVFIKTYINNTSYKVIDSTKPLTLENGGYVGYTMQPAAVQTSYGQSQTAPYDYRLGVDYEFKTQLPAGPHTYFFAAYDGTSNVIFPNRPDDWTYGGVTWGDWWVPDSEGGLEGFDNNYFPGPYINHACELISPSVTPASGVQGRNYRYRVLYRDADNQRPYQASVYVETGVSTLGDNGVIRADMIKEDPTASDYTLGVWYYADTATMENFSMAKGIRHYRFEFIDDWGRQTDPNDRIRGETTKSPASGGWIDGPTVADNVRPTLRNGQVVSTDGSSNGATLWNFSVNYKDINNDEPKQVAVYIGELLADGQTIQWDSGHEMSKADATDVTYNNGCQYIFQTRLRGAQNVGDPEPIYYYAFEASDGANLATWVSSDYPDEDARSESAGCMLQDSLSTDDNLTYSASKNRLVGRLPNSPVSAGTLIDPILWRYPGGDLTIPEIISRSNDPDDETDYYVVKGLNWGTDYDSETGLTKYQVIRYASVDAAYAPVIDEVLGVFIYEDLSGTNYFLAEDGTPGLYDGGSIWLERNLPAGTDWVWIKYRYNSGYTLNRWTGEFTFGAAQSADDVFTADYFFATQLATPISANQPPALLNPKLTPLVGSSGTSFTYSVTYKETEGMNGQVPVFVRVVIDGVAHDMTPVAVGVPSYRAGVTYRYTTSLPAGSHTYYFETSDGVGTVTLPATNATTGSVTPYQGPWVNDKPVLLSGAANPNPAGDTIAADEPVTYTVTYTDSDNDAPITYYPFADDATAVSAIQGLAFATPLLFVDNADETWTVGTVAEAVEDAAEPGKYRSIRVQDKTGATPAYTADEFAGKLLQFTSGTLAGQVYLIVNNTGTTLKLLTDDLVDDGLEVGDIFSIGVLQMFKANPADQNYAVGISYMLTAPQLAEGEHSFHFKGASVLSPPQWLIDLDATYATVTQSDWVRFPAAGELSGPTVAVEVPSTNHAPVLSMQDGDSAVSPVSGKTSDTYDFFVTYKDDDGDPPRYHDNVLGYVRVVFDDGLYAAEMTPETAEDTSNPTFYTTQRRFKVRAIGLPEGVHKFHFDASDGWSKARWPVPVDLGDPTADDPEVSVNYKARLTNITITPPGGNTTSTFAISVTYTDPDGLAPFVEAGKEQVWVEIGSSATKVYLTRSSSDSNFATGVTYRGTKTGLAANTYTTEFKAKDNVGETTTVAGPTLRVSDNLTAPTVTSPKVYNVSRPSDINNLATGGSVDNFKYEVTYSDADGDVPLVLSGGVWIEGIELYIDGVLGGILTQKVGTSDPDFVAGVTYYYQKAGRTFQPGSHNFQFKANDGMTDGSHAVQTAVTQGPSIISAAISLSRETYDRTLGAWEARDPKLTENLRISGALIGSELKPIAGSQKILISIARPDGTGETFSVTASSANKFSFERIPTINKNWTFTARWEGNVDYKPAVVNDLTVDVKGPTRVVATLDMSEPVNSAPAIDMVCMPLTAPNRDAGTLFGFDRSRLMQIARWDPVERTYLRYGDNYFPPLDPGAAVWVYPGASYPAEAVDTANVPSPADPDYPVSASSRYRLFKPYGRLWDAATDCELVMKTGWNQFGSPYLSSVQLSRVKVAYQGKTVSIDQAAQNGWIRNYAWMWDVASQTYKLVHTFRPDTFSRTIDTWRGYWIKLLVDCVVILPAPGASAASAAAAAEEVGAMDVSGLAVLDEPPPAPRAGR